MSNSKLIEAARKAKGSRILPTVLLGQRYDAEELLLAMADGLQACEWNYDMEAAPTGVLCEVVIKNIRTKTDPSVELLVLQKEGSWTTPSKTGMLNKFSVTPTAWRIITLPEESQND